MQVMWSRTAQVRSCQCLSCIHAATTIARRATTAASRSRLRANDVFTACYSAMFATAALVDMKRKDDRRKQWDIAIAEAKASSSALPEASFSNNLQPDTYESGPGQSEQQNLNLSEAFQVPIKWDPSTDLDAHKLNNQTSIRPPRGQSLPLDGSLKYLNMEVQKISSRMNETAETKKSSKGGIKLRDREPRTQVHLERMQIMVWELVTNFLKGNGSLEIVAPVIRQHQIERPKYTQSRPWMSEERKALDVVITKILEDEVSSRSNIDLAVSKICYNLLISAAPPSIVTYNIMLIYFTRLKAHHLAQMVIDSFFGSSKFRPNYNTAAAILDHYAAIGDQKGFRDVIRRMRGVKGHMRITKITSLDPDESRQARGYEPRLTVCHRPNQTLVTVMPLNSNVFNSLIRGSLHLYGVRQALKYFKAAIRGGWRISGDLFDSLGKACLAELDVEAAISILSTIATRYYQVEGLPFLESLSSSRKIILQMMKMCRIKLWVDRKQTQPIQSRYDIFYVLKAWLVALQAEILHEKIGQSAKIIEGLEMVVTVYTVKEFHNERVILGMLDTTDHYLYALAAQRCQLGAVTTAAQMVIDVFAGNFKQIEAQVFNSAYLSLPTASAQKFHTMRKLWPNMDKTSLLEMSRKVPRLKDGIDNEDVEPVFQYRIGQELRPIDNDNAETWLANQYEGPNEWMKTVIA